MAKLHYLRKWKKQLNDTFETNSNLIYTIGIIVSFLSRLSLATLALITFACWDFLS